MWRISRRGFLASAGAIPFARLTPTSAAGQTTTHPAIEGIVSAGGLPLGAARVSNGEREVVTGPDGAFVIEPVERAADGTLRVNASGYREWRAPLDGLAGPLDVQLELRPIRALYLNPTVTSTMDQVDALIGVIDSTIANAVVIDIKEEVVWYDTGVQFFRDAGTVQPGYDITELLQRFKASNIYTIARLVLFKDSVVAEVRPDLAIHDVTTGGPWRDMNGVAWVNPMREELWEPNIELAIEAAGHGFDEIQYDYVRFPTDGDLSTMDFGVPYTQEARQAAIEGFLARSRERLLPTGARQSADVFGFAMVVDDDVGIGQHFASLAAHVDYLSPMVYPSHYSENQFGLPGHPNDYPYEIVDISLDGGVARLEGDALRIRPWLQDFDLQGMTPYGADQVRAQIQAADEHGTSGWMLWDPENRWRTGHLDPEPPGEVPNPENVAEP